VIAEGSRAPSFDASSTGGRFSLDDVLESGPLVLFFYPKAATPGCTNEVNEFEAWFDRFSELGVRIAGCSTDELDAQKAFADRWNGFRFPLIADPDASIATAYGVLRPDAPRAKRQTVVVAEDGTVLKTYVDVPADAKGHAAAVFADCETLFG
jgi:thioredoxin-dependent peroxiredoxin